MLGTKYLDHKQRPLQLRMYLLFHLPSAKKSVLLSQYVLIYLPSISYYNFVNACIKSGPVTLHRGAFG
jgi:hypothetical protein